MYCIFELETQRYGIYIHNPPSIHTYTDIQYKLANELVTGMNFVELNVAVMGDNHFTGALIQFVCPILFDPVIQSRAQQAFISQRIASIYRRDASHPNNNALIQSMYNTYT